MRRFTLRAYSIALLTVVAGVLLSLRLGDWGWFARSGALLVVNGIILTSHHIIEHIHNLNHYQRQRDTHFNRDWARDDKRLFIQDDPAARWLSEKHGLYLLIVGTLIWGFGDLLNGL